MSEVFRKHLSEEARGGSWTENVNAGINSTQLVLKAEGIDQITQKQNLRSPMFRSWTEEETAAETLKELPEVGGHLEGVVSGKTFKGHISSRRDWAETI